MTKFQVGRREFVAGVSIGALVGSTGTAYGASSSLQAEEATITVEDVETTAGQTGAAELVLSQAPEGLAGFSVAIDIEDTSIGELTSAEVDDKFGLSDTTVTASSVIVVGSDSEQTVQSGAEDITLAQITVQGEGEGETRLSLSVNQVDDDSGTAIDPGTDDGQLTVTGDGEPDGFGVVLSPDTVEMEPDQTREVGITARNATNGVAAFDLSVAVESASVVEVTDATVVNDSLGSTEISPDGSELTLEHALTDDPHSAGDPTVARFTISSKELDETVISVTDATVSDRDSNSYGINDLGETDVTVTDNASPPVIVGSDAPTDPDGDGFYEDIDGSGEFDIFDVQALFNNLDNSDLQDNAEAFKFSGDSGDEVTIFDVQALFNEL